MAALTKIQSLPYAQPATFLGLLLLSQMFVLKIQRILPTDLVGGHSSYLLLLAFLFIVWKFCDRVFGKIYLARLPFPKAILHLSVGFAIGLFIFLVRNCLLLTEQNMRDLSQQFAARFWSAEGLYLFCFAALIAVVEEGTCRGYLFPAIEKTKGPVVAFWLTAIIFGLFHIDSVLQINDFIGGVMLAFMVVLRAGLLFTAAYWWRRSLFFCVGLHMGVDFTGMFIFGDHDSQIAPLTTLDKSGGVFLLFGRLLIGYVVPVATAFVFVWLARRRDAVGSTSNKPEPF